MSNNTPTASEWSANDLSNLIHEMTLKNVVTYAEVAEMLPSEHRAGMVSRKEIESLVPEIQQGTSSEDFECLIDRVVISLRSSVTLSTQEITERINQLYNEFLHGCCRKCGGTTFYASQRVYISVLVDGEGTFVDNVPDVVESISCAENPYGPFTCKVCGVDKKE